MAKFKTIIQLEDAGERDYKTLQTELEKQTFRTNKHLFKGKNNGSGQKEYQWTGNITIQEIANAIFRAATKTGKKFSFTIMKNKPVTG